MRLIRIFLTVAMVMAILTTGGGGIGIARAADASTGDSAAYRIGAGDVLEITTWKEPDFSKEVTVRPDGFITFPLLDDMAAAGMTTTELKEVLTQKLSRFVAAPQVTVTVKAPAEKKIYVMGEVAKPGEYLLQKGMTVLQAIAMAGGFTEWASKKEIMLMRKDKGEERVFLINYKAIVNKQDLSENLILQPNDTIVVP